MYALRSVRQKVKCFDNVNITFMQIAEEVESFTALVNIGFFDCLANLLLENEEEKSFNVNKTL